MKRILTLLFTVIITSISCYTQEVTSSETWSGEISVGTRKLNVGFVIKTMSDGKQICTLDVPDQGAKNIPAELLKNNSDSLNISFPYC